VVDSAASVALYVALDTSLAGNKGCNVPSGLASANSGELSGRKREADSPTAAAVVLVLGLSTDVAR
jgi:hypothetical protein